MVNPHSHTSQVCVGLRRLCLINFDGPSDTFNTSYMESSDVMLLPS